MNSLPLIHGLLANSFGSLQDALALLPPTIHVELHVIFPSRDQEDEQRLGPTPTINDFADAVLRAVFEHARATRSRSDGFIRGIVFSSFNPEICMALNWKQPNCEC